MGEVEHPDRARRADRAAAGARVRHSAGSGRSRRRSSAGSSASPRRARSRGRRSCRRLGLRVVVQHEGAAAEAARLRLDEAENGLHRDRRIGRGAAGLEDVAAGPARQRIGGDDHVRLRRDDLLAGLVARRRLGRGGVAGKAGADDDRAGVGDRLAFERARFGDAIVVVAAAARGQQHRRRHERKLSEKSERGTHAGLEVR